MKKITVFLFFQILSCSLLAQSMPDIDDIDSVKRVFENMPSFGLYKDNYFSLGTTIGHRPDCDNSDVKFQISIRQRLTRRRMPFDTYLFLFYTQKSFWNVFENSLPMHDNNYNPGLSWVKFIRKNARFRGMVQLVVEHESNGRDGDESRSWNKIGLSASYFVNKTAMFHGKVFYPFIDDDGQNKDICKYAGIFQFGAQKLASNGRWVFDLTFTKREGWDFNFNTMAEVGFRVFRANNQYLFLQYYNGYGENMLDYNSFHSRLRIGMLIRPEFFSTF